MMAGATARVGTGSDGGVASVLKDVVHGIPTRGSALLEMTVKNILYDKKTVVFFALTIFLLIIPSYWAYVSDTADISGLDLFVVITMMIYIQFIVLYSSLLFGSSLFSEEEEQRTMTYILSRPVSNLEIVAYKYIGYVISVFVMLAIPLLINFGIIAIKTPFGEVYWFLYELGQFLGLLFMAIAAWGAFFMFLGIFLRRYALIAGLLYALFWETFIANIPTAIRFGTVNHYIRSMAPIYLAFGDDPTGLGGTGWGWALATLVGFSVFFIVLTLYTLRRKDFH